MTIDINEWFQVSRRYRLVARFPTGKKPKEALRDAMLVSHRERDPKLTALPEHWEQWINMLDDRNAGDHFLRCHTHQFHTPELCKQLPVAEFAAFRAAGGDTYDGRAR